MNFEQLKQSLLSSQSDSERVEVNQRHLIDKILARYSAEHTIYRELLQNSNDAQASKVIIKFITIEKKITSLSYQNNGKLFSSTDFDRLTKIAQGNPDEQKIGFFGVGFYSLFSICEEPFLSSGSQSMGFFWKGDALYTKKAAVPPENVTEWTTFWLKCREPLELPSLSDFARFLATSLAFTTFVKEVEVFIDNERIQTFLKKVSIPRPLSFKSGDFTLKSQNSIFTLNSVDLQSIQLDFTLKEEKSSFLGPTKIIESDFTLFTKIAVGSLVVTLPKALEKEMERTTKKNPPNTVKVQILYSNYDEYSSSNSMKEKTDIFTDLMPGPTSQGRIFIGFPTFQTTGCSIQLSTHLIPTVERESIDFVDKTLNIWNQEILSMGGLVARIVAEDDLDSTAKLYQEMQLDQASEEWLQKKGNHNLSSFTFHHSTPSPIVSKILSTNFYKLCYKPIRLVSTKGIVPISCVRLKDSELPNFFKSIPILASSSEESCKDLVKRLMDNGTLKKVAFEDIFHELSSRPLSSSETILIFQYWIKKWRQQMINRSLSDRLRSVLILNDEDRLLPMSEAKFYALPQVIPSDLPIPNSVLPLKISKHFIKLELEQALWGLSEYTFNDWLAYISREDRFGLDPAFTEKVMAVCSRQFGSLSQQDKLSMAARLEMVDCVVTRLGMKKPLESYFKSVNIFDDLATVHWSNPRSISNTFQKAIGVREHVDLQLIFDRLLELNWNHTQLIKYLASVQEKLSETEFARLRATHLFPKESSLEKDSSKNERFQAKDLYAPLDSFRAFDLPLLSWNGKWRTNSDEAKLMGKLGLNLIIPLESLLEMASSSITHRTRMALIGYYIDNYQVSYASSYRPLDVKHPFIPIENDQNSLCTPSLCFSDDGSQVLGFNILHRDLKPHSQKLGVKNHPSNSVLLKALEANPPSSEKSISIFNYLSSRQFGFDRDDWQKLRNMKFIPITRNGMTVWMSPLQVYFGKSEDKILSDHFTYIDFGISCNAFLSACGVKDEPSPPELADMIIKDPDGILSDRGIENYLSLLRLVASNYPLLKNNSALVSSMKDSPFLIGIKNKDPHDGADVVYQLAVARDIFIIDDTVVGQLFNALGAPVESLLETMYQDLGSTWLSKQVKEFTTPIGQIQETKRAKEIQNLIHERAPLLLYDGQHMRSSKEIAVNADKVLKTLKVVEVDEIEMSRNLLGLIKKQKTTACLLADRRSSAFVLYIAGDLDFFDVSNALSRIIFKQPRLNDSLLLSTLLSTSLENLRRKGFPVDRILNLKKNMKFVEQIGHKPRNAGVSADIEADKVDQLLSLFPHLDRSLILDELQRASGSENPLMVAANSLAEKANGYTSNQTTKDKYDQKSGDNSTSKESYHESTVGMLKFFNNIRKNLGFQTDAVDQSVENVKRSPQNTREHDITPSKSSSIKQQLSSSISRLSIIDDSRIRAQVPLDTPSSESLQQNLCQIISDADLTLIRSIDGIRFYLDRALAASQRDYILKNQDSALKRFSLLLKHLAHVFRIDIQTIAIYWDEKGDTIAFNRSRSLFFNAKYYAGLHYPNVKSIGTSSMPGSYGVYNTESQISIQDEDLNTFFYWFMTFCHELAHNFVSAHDANHEFWMSSFAEQYLQELIIVLKGIGKI